MTDATRHKPEGRLRRLGAGLRTASQSRSAWFFLQRLSSNGFGFALTAVLTHVIAIDQLAEFLAAYALASIFEPLFGQALNLYLIRLLRDTTSLAERDLVMRSVFVVMQVAAAVGVLLLIWVQLADPRAHLFSAMIFVQIVFTPWKLFTAPLFVADRFREITQVQVVANLVGGAARVGVLLATRDLFVVALLMCVEPIIVGVVLSWRAGVKVFARPLVSRRVLHTVLASLPSLMGAMVLVCVFWRSPVMLARWVLGPLDVVHIALCAQVIAGLSIIQATLADSITGPLSKTSRDDGAFIAMLRLGSSMTFLFGASAILGLAVGGEWAMTLVFGSKAAGAGTLMVLLAPLCMFGGMNRLLGAVINLRGRPVQLFATWGVALACQAIVAGLLHRWPTPLLIAGLTPLSLLVGLAAGALIPQSTRKFAAAVMLGFTKLVGSRSMFRDMVVLMLGSGHAPPAAPAPERPA